MGWFSKQSSSTTPSTDPLRDLDPSLRDFLSKESPIKYTPAAPPPPEPTVTPPPSPPTQSQDPTTPSIPSESLYPDGRYAHLWKNYRPLSAIEAESKSDQEKLSDVLDGYKARKAQIGRAALENCVFEQMKIDDCYENGSYMDRLRMCRKENREFERCYLMQSRFLKALGYLSTFDRPDELEERIQMHADSLYHRMLAQEKAIEEAKASNQPVPSFSPILSQDSTSSATSSSTASIPSMEAINRNSTTNSPSQPSHNPLIPQPSQPPEPPQPSTTLPTLSPATASLLSTDSQLKLRHKLSMLTPAERELEERSVQMEARTAQDVAVRMREVEEGRKKRRDEGRGTVGDTVAGWFGW